jgi:hypothetical protein
MPNLKAFEVRKRPFFMQKYLFLSDFKYFACFWIFPKPLFGIARLWDIVTREPLL